MKLLAAILVFMIAAQPVQAGFCDMQPSGDPAAHSGMQHDGMHPPALPQKGQDHPSGHDCCDPNQRDDGDSGSACRHQVACGSCVAGLSGAVASVDILAAWNSAQRPALVENDFPTRHTSPPFRPPIDLS